MEFEQQIPEFCPDAARLIRVDCRPFAEKAEYVGSGITIGGKAEFDVIYETDRKGKLRCCSFEREFTEEIPFDAGCENVAVSASAVCDRVNCKLIGPRRLAIKTTVSGDIEVECDLPYKAIAAVGDGNVFFRKAAIGYDGAAQTFEKTFEFNEQLPLTQTERGIGEMIYARAELAPPQVNILPGRAEIRSNASVKVFYEDEASDEDYYLTAKDLPLDFLFEDPAIDERSNARCLLEVVECSVIPELDQYGESRILKVGLKVKATLKTSVPRAETVAVDVFERGADDEFVTVKALLPHLESTAERSFTLETEIPPAAPMFLSVIDRTVNCRTTGAERAEGGIILKGVAAVTVTGRTENGIYCVTHRTPFEQFVQVDFGSPGDKFDVEIYPVDVSTVLRPDGSVSAKMIFAVKVRVYGETLAEFISEITSRREINEPDSGSVMIFRYPKKGENVWDIAKEYRRDPETISAANPKRFGDSGEIDSSPEPILIK